MKTGPECKYNTLESFLDKWNNHPPIVFNINLQNKTYLNNLKKYINKNTKNNSINFETYCNLIHNFIYEGKNKKK